MVGCDGVHLEHARHRLIAHIQGSMSDTGCNVLTLDYLGYIRLVVSVLTTPLNSHLT